MKKIWGWMGQNHPCEFDCRIERWNTIAQARQESAGLFCSRGGPQLPGLYEEESAAAGSGSANMHGQTVNLVQVIKGMEHLIQGKAWKALIRVGNLIPVYRHREQ